MFIWLLCNIKSSLVWIIYPTKKDKYIYLDYHYSPFILKEEYKIGNFP